MTANERLEKLLNRAGQTISDLPRAIDYTIPQEQYVMEAAAEFGSGLSYICHLTDVIDRMETALENLLNERDWMIREMRDIGFCYTCYFHRVSTEFTAPPECDDCDPNSRENIMYCYGGVPEEWRADDD